MYIAMSTPPHAESYTCAPGKMPNIVAYWGNGGDVRNNLTGITDALDIPAVYNVLQLTFLLFNDGTFAPQPPPGNVPQWCLWTWGAGIAYADTLHQNRCGESWDTTDFSSPHCLTDANTCSDITTEAACTASPDMCVWDPLVEPSGACTSPCGSGETCISPPSLEGWSILPNLEKWKEETDPWGRPKYILLALGGAPGYAFQRHVISGLETYTGNIAQAFARDETVKKLYYANFCDGFDMDLEKADRTQMDTMVKNGTFDWRTYLETLKEVYGDDFKMFTAAPEIADLSLNLFKDWFKMGETGDTIFTGIGNLEYFIGTQFYNNNPNSIGFWFWSVGYQTDKNSGILYDPVALKTWDYVIQEQDCSDNIAPAPQLCSEKFVGLSLMQAANLYFNLKTYANMKGNMGILMPNGLYSCLNATVPPPTRDPFCAGWLGDTFDAWEEIPWVKNDYESVPKYLGSWSLETGKLAKTWPQPQQPQPQDPGPSKWTISMEKLLNGCENNGGPNLPSFAYTCNSA